MLAARRIGRVRRVSGLVALGALVIAVILAVRVADGDGTGIRSDGVLVAISTAIVLSLLGLILLALHPERGGLRRLAGVSWVITVVFLAALGSLWYLTTSEVRDRPTSGIPVDTQVEVDAALAPYLARADAAAVAPPYQVPTGVFLQSINFIDSHDVAVHGYVWQEYAAGIPTDVPRGVVLPEAVEDSYGAQEVYREPTADGGERIGWSFHAVLRQRFNYRRYPFDHQEVGVRLWQADLRHQAVLVPDFSAYPSTDARELPGVGPDFVYQGWQPEFTAFSYAPRTYSSTFGLAGPTALPDYPELTFTFGVRRESFGPFFDHAFPQVVVALLLYATLFLTSPDVTVRRGYGFYVFEILRFCAALLFVAILAHNQLRDAIASDQLVYLETFPFLVYLALLLVALNGLLVELPLFARGGGFGDNASPAWSTGRCSSASSSSSP